MLPLLCFFHLSFLFNISTIDPLFLYHFFTLITCTIIFLVILQFLFLQRFIFFSIQYSSCCILLFFCHLTYKYPKPFFLYQRSNVIIFLISTVLALITYSPLLVLPETSTLSPSQNRVFPVPVMINGQILASILFSFCAFLVLRYNAATWRYLAPKLLTPSKSSYTLKTC